VDELGDIDRVRCLLVQGLDLFRRKGDVLAFGEFIAFGHVVLFDDSTFLRADVLLLETAAAGFMQHVETDCCR